MRWWVAFAAFACAEQPVVPDDGVDGAVEGDDDDEPLPGDPEHGAVLFETHCVSCHEPPEGIRLTACVYEEHDGWEPGDLAGFPLDEMALQIVYGGECMPPFGVPLTHANGLGPSPMLSRDEVEDLVTFVALTYGDR